MSILSIYNFNKSNFIKEQCNDNKYQFSEYKFNDINIEFGNDGVCNNNNITFNEDKTILGFMIGEIYDLDIEMLKNKGHILETDSDIEYIIHLYEEYGEKALENLNGKFIILLIDKKRQLQILLNDRYGLMNFYYYNINGKYMFSNYSQHIVHTLGKKEVDEVSIREFFNCGCILDDRTMIKDVKRLQQGIIVKIKNNQVEFRKYFDWNAQVTKTKDNYEEALEKLFKLWINAVKKVMIKHEKFNMPISGGMDSRLIVSAIDYLNLNDKINISYTVGIRGCGDHLVAMEVAKRANLKYKFYEINNQEYLDYIEERTKNTLRYPLIKAMYFGLIDKSIFKYPCLSGLFMGETLGGDFFHSDIDRFHSKLYGIENRQMINEILRSKEDNISKSESECNLKDGFYYIYKYFINKISVINDIIGDNYNIYPILLENKFYDYLRSLPPEWTKGRKIQTELSIKYFPKFFTDIPYERTRLPVMFNLNKGEIEKYSQCCKLISKSINTKYKNAIIFGAGSFGEKVYKVLKDTFNIIYFCDNDSSKWGSKFCGISVISPEKLKELKEYSIIVASTYYKEILAQLDNMDIEDYKFIGFTKNTPPYIDFNLWLKNKYVLEKIDNVIRHCEFMDKITYRDKVKGFLEKFKEHNYGKDNDFLNIISVMYCLKNNVFLSNK
ncbi:DEAD/DEAH box helicase [Clostridium sporogenes]|uniref:asparagine synthase-related protein n=1 Tax=Clostridium sporogenes TaxID=1509 RepID=UPI0013D447FE|nr:asparagine synthase-related protein [Clostridium sporogenes]EJE7233280.1 DEAD/DEAH box helicase [Clostridium botulinum]NFG67700.1 DEAD/DEAH box helicase [Clostridium sporogenes]